MNSLPQFIGIFNELSILPGQVMMRFFLYLVQNFLITFVSIPFLVSFARRKGLLYKPVHRSSHTEPTPAFGGIAIFSGFLLTLLFISSFSDNYFMPVVIPAVVIFIVGLADDLKGLGAWIKLFLFIAISYLISNEMVIDNMHGFAGIHELSPVHARLLTILVIVLVLNAMNLIDGIDGLAASQSIIVLAIFSRVFYQAGNIFYLCLTIPMIISLLAFMVYNVWGKKNKIFMGDSGSLLSGLVIAVSLIQFLQTDPRTVYDIRISPVTVFGLLIVPVFDTLHVFLIRIMKGRSPFSPDKSHIHHTFLNLGFSHLQATVILAGYTILFLMVSQVLEKHFSVTAGMLIMTGLAFAGWKIPIWRSTKPILPRPQLPAKGEANSSDAEAPPLNGL